MDKAFEERLGLPKERIIIEFIGGDADGKILDSNSNDKIESILAKTLYKGLRNGAIGASLDRAPMDVMERLAKWEQVEIKNLRRYRYDVIDQLQEGDGVIALGISGTDNAGTADRIASLTLPTGRIIVASVLAATKCVSGVRLGREAAFAVSAITFDGTLICDIRLETSPWAYRLTFLSRCIANRRILPQISQLTLLGYALMA